MEGEEKVTGIVVVDASVVVKWFVGSIVVRQGY